MSDYFFDSSGIVKRYVNETGTAWVTGIMDPAAGNTIYLVRLTGVELVSAITRRVRTGTVSAGQAAGAIARFRTEFKYAFRVVGITVALVKRGMTLAEIHALRAYDAVQLAAALQVHKQRRSLGQSLILVSADAELNAAAAAEGLLVEDPNSHP